MIPSSLMIKRTETVPCTIEIENTFDSLHAHVELHGTEPTEAGDEVQVHGDPIRVPYGQKLTLQRTATIARRTATREPHAEHWPHADHHFRCRR